MKRILTIGSKWPLEEIDEQLRKSDLNEALCFGNHKGTSKNPELLKQLVTKDVILGYCLPIPLDQVKKLKKALMAPMNIMSQNMIDKTGQIVEKDCLTHNQSYKWGSGTSVNSQVRKDELLPCMFRACI